MYNFWYFTLQVASIIRNNPRSRTISNPDNPNLLHLGGLIGDLQVMSLSGTLLKCLGVHA